MERELWLSKASLLPHNLELPWLVNLCVDLPGGANIAEVGTGYGGTAASIARAIASHMKQLWCVDNWSYPEASRGRGDEQKQQWLSSIAESGNGDFVHLVEADTTEGAAQFEDGFFDLVFIDGFHIYPKVADDIIAWLPKLKPDGILAGDDWHRLWPGVEQAVREVLGYPVLIGRCWAVPMEGRAR